MEKIEERLRDYYQYIPKNIWWDHKALWVGAFLMTELALVSAHVPFIGVFFAGMFALFSVYCIYGYFHLCVQDMFHRQAYERILPELEWERKNKKKKL